MYNQNNLPAINSYEDLIAFNNSLPQTSQPLNIEKVSYAKNIITVNGEKVGIDRFLYNYIINPCSLTGKINRLREYDFSRLVLLVYPEAFLEEFKSRVNNLILLGMLEDKRITLWDFQIEIGTDDITIVASNNPRAEEVVIPYFITRIGKSAFQYHSSLRKVFFQDGSRLKSIDGRAFFACKHLKEINLPDGLTNIWDECFSETALESIRLPDNLKKIDYGAFSQCVELRSVTIGKVVKEIGTSAFCFCANLQKVKILGNVEKIGENAFSYTDIEELVLPNSVKKSLYEVAKKMFKSYYTPISINSDLDAVKVAIADGCINLKSVRFI